MPTTSVATELFGGANGSAWPAAWTEVVPTLTQQNGRGQLAPAAGAGAASVAVWSGPAGLTNTEITGDYAFPTAALDQSAIVGVRSNGVAGSTPGLPVTGYYLRFDPLTSGVSLWRADSATVQTLLWSGTFAWSNNVPGYFRLRAENTTGGVVLSLRLWTGATEPLPWTVVLTDTDPAQQTGVGQPWVAQINGAGAGATVGSVNDLLLFSITAQQPGAQADDLVLPQLAVNAPATPAAGTQTLYATSAGLRTKLPAGTDAVVYPLSSAGAPAISTFTTVGAATWTKPANAKWVEIICIGGGGGGGGAGMDGAAGGGGATRGRVVAPASALGATEAVTVGAGGTGGAGRTDGLTNPGGKGGDSSFGTTTRICAGLGGFGGKAATTGPGDSKGGPGGGTYGRGGDGISRLTNAQGGGPQGFNPQDYGPGGGGGPGYFTNNAGAQGGTNQFDPVGTVGGGAGGAGSAANGSAASAGAAGPSQAAGKPMFGGGGGGGGSTYSGWTGRGGNGGAGGLYGAGGGGGGGAVTASGGGTGGNGAQGIVVVITYFA